MGLSESDWHWTDFLVVFMAVNFLIIILWQYICTPHLNGGNKYKTL